MSERVLAATTIGAFRTEIREYPFPGGSIANFGTAVLLR